jgi:hypothetical protein
MSAMELVSPHKHEQRGNESMKKFKFGNTTVVIHSKLVLMSADERKEWYRKEWEKGNPVLKQIAQAVIDCYRPKER